jgi:hypothetical protein
MEYQSLGVWWTDLYLLCEETGLEVGLDDHLHLQLRSKENIKNQKMIMVKRRVEGSVSDSRSLSSVNPGRQKRAQH